MRDEMDSPLNEYISERKREFAREPEGCPCGAPNKAIYTHHNADGSPVRASIMFVCSLDDCELGFGE